MKAPERSINLLSVTGLFDFMGISHPVFQDDESKQKVIYVKGLVDQISIDWKTQRVKLNNDESVELYSTANYKSIGKLEGPRPSEIAVEGGGIGSLEHKNEPEFVKPKEGLYLPLESIQMYLARLSISQVKNQGNESAAKFILSLQKEWLKALNSYETHGLAVKDSHKKQDKERSNLLTEWNKLAKSENAKVRAIAQHHIELMFEELGLNLEKAA